MARKNTAGARAVKTLIGILGAAAVAVGVFVAGPGLTDAVGGLTGPGGASSSAPEPAPSALLTSGGDYVVVLGDAERVYEPSSAGVVEYCPLDSLGRTVCAYGELTASLRDAAKNTGRQDITVDPSGWPRDNGESTIPALADVEGSKDYNGWFWNRSHLVADSLGGDAVVENLVTGTRTQNVGSAQTQGQYSGGMARTELIARDYLDSQHDDSCPLYYAATPQYQGDELIPRSVRVDVLSCDGSINVAVEALNAANGWSIDYFTGARERTQ